MNSNSNIMLGQSQFSSHNQVPVGGANARANVFNSQNVPTAPLAVAKRPVKSGGGASGRYDYSAKQSLSGIFDECEPPQSALDRAKKAQPHFGLDHATSASELL